MPLHPFLQSMVDQAKNLPPMHTVPVLTIRAGDAARYETNLPLDPVGSTEDRLIPGAVGGIRVRIYWPTAAKRGPILVFFHGSGFVICSIETHDAMCRQICHRSGVIVISVDYRLAPEHRFPAAPDDCLAATLWAADHASELGGDATRMGVAGDSAGGNLAAVTALRLRDQGGPKLRAQLLMYPVTDHYSANWPSYRENGSGYGLTRETMTWFWDQYLTDPSLKCQPYVSPLRAEDLSRLPPTYIVTAEYDVLRDEGEQFAERLAQVGVPTEQYRYREVNHGFMMWVGLVNHSTDAMNAACQWLKNTL